jgi:hypothetical protein
MSVAVGCKENKILLADKVTALEHAMKKCNKKKAKVPTNNMRLDKMLTCISKKPSMPVAQITPQIIQNKIIAIESFLQESQQELSKYTQMYYSANAPTTIEEEEPFSYEKLETKDSFDSIIPYMNSNIIYNVNPLTTLPFS